MDPNGAERIAVQLDIWPRNNLDPSGPFLHCTSMMQISPQSRSLSTSDQNKVRKFWIHAWGNLIAVLLIYFRRILVILQKYVLYPGHSPKDFRMMRWFPADKMAVSQWNER